MNHPAILALGYSEASMLLRQPMGAAVDAIISIQGGHEFAVEAPDITRKLILHFDDVEAVNLADPETAHRAWAQRKWFAEIGRVQNPPTIEDARAIIEFALSISDEVKMLLCHCQGGISRSPAAALLCLATWAGKGHEGYCAEELLRIRPCAAPHRDLVAYGDKLLGREGELVRAVTEAQHRIRG